MPAGISSSGVDSVLPDTPHPIVANTVHDGGWKDAGQLMAPREGEIKNGDKGKTVHRAAPPPPKKKQLVTICEKL